MSVPAVVQIIGTPIACAEGYKDAWRDIAVWVAGQLKARFGESVTVVYYDLFDPDCPAMPGDAQLPLVLLNDQVVSSGGKISVPAIRKHLEQIGVLAEHPQNIPSASTG